jgi:hypothetical protein
MICSQKKFDKLRSTFINLPAPSHTNMMSRGTKRRVAATEAENKIKSALEELMGWSDSKEDSFEASFYAFYDASDPEDAGSSSKKPKIDNTKPAAKESQKNPTNKTKGAAATSKNKQKNDTKAASNKEVSDPALDTAEWDCETMTESELEELMLMELELEEERELKERDDRRAARLVHSNRPMFLSRHLSWKLSRIPDTSPIYSPLAACHLSFAPSSVAILVTRRT